LTLLRCMNETRLYAHQAVISEFISNDSANLVTYVSINLTN
jgi:hypothetical protein